VAGLGADEDGKVLEGPPLTPPIGAVWSAPRVALAEAVNGAPLDSRDIRGRRGFDLDAPFDTLTVGETGRATLYGEELDRFELHFRNGDASTSERYSGYLRVGAELSSLPIGSRLEEASGIFTWSAGPGFLRDYDLVFVRWEAGRAAARQEVRIVIKPQSRNRVGPQVAIDSPQAGSEIDGTFIVAGWAIDPDSSIDTGVNTLHVWAYPTASPDRPIFLGAAAYGGKRPDVSAIHGDRFERSGYAITVDMLPPGTYDIAVFAWSTATGGFVPAKVVRVNRRE
jgi:hypothetical protein